MPQTTDGFTNQFNSEVQENWSEVYKNFLRPRTGKLLEMLGLDVVFTHGSGNQLTYKDQLGNEHQILDATGGYGANLLGHKNPELIQSMIDVLTQGAPVQLQGSIRKESAKLGEMLSNLLKEETGCGPWVTTLSNSGAEAIEAALKHAMMYSHFKIEKMILHLNENLTSMKLVWRQSRKKEVLWKDLLSMFSNLPVKGESFEEVLENLKNYNLQILEKSQKLLALKNSFHGKSMGALSATYNPEFRKAFIKEQGDTIFIERNNLPELFNKIQQLVEMLVMIDADQDENLLIKKIPFIRVYAMIIEPIQGEAGVYPIHRMFLEEARSFATKYDFQLIFDEIQSGFYRCGYLSSAIRFKVVADIYTFSKALGGGMTKIGATVIRSSLYMEKFGLVHTSTFAEDNLSSSVALKTLEILSRPGFVSQAMNQGKTLKTGLLKLKEENLEIVKDVRGEGLMLAIEISREIRQMAYDFKVFCDIRFVGYLMTSALFHNEGIRMAPTLSNPYSLRIQPSLYVTDEEIQKIINGLKNMIKALKEQSGQYFFGHLFPKGVGVVRPIEKGAIEYKDSKGQRDCAVFLNHLISADQARKMVGVFDCLNDEEIEEHLMNMFHLLEFEVYYRGPLRGKNGKEIDIVMLSIPLTSQALAKIAKSKNAYMLIKKIQSAIAYAKSLGATTVGLGQFTSIVSKNGLKLDPMGMNLTTGNSYTCALSIEAGLKASEKKGLEVSNASVGLVGAAGNIITVTASIMARKCASIGLFYHTSLQKSPKLQNVMRDLLKDFYEATEKSLFIEGMKPLISQKLEIFSSQEALVQFCQDDQVRKYLKIEENLESLHHYDLVYSGVNSSSAIIEQRHLKENVVVVDIAVPQSVNLEIMSKRSDVTLILGGVAQMPQYRNEMSRIILNIYPLKDGQAYACMSETFMLSLHEQKDCLFIGPISRQQVSFMEELAKATGFELAEFKTIHSL